MKVDKIKAQKNTIYENGYGIIAKKVMTDKRLSIEAKAIYAYLASFAGAGEAAFPSVDLILGQLKISKTRFYKHREQLEKYGYITIKTEKTEANKFPRNIYVLNILPCPCFKDTQIKDTQNRDTNNNNLNNNNLNNNSKYITSFLQNDDFSPLFLKIYLKYFSDFLGKEHMQIKKEQLDYVIICMQELEEVLNEEEYTETVEDYFKSLPKKNNGNVLTFLKASKRLLDIELDVSNY